MSSILAIQETWCLHLSAIDRCEAPETVQIFAVTLLASWVQNLDDQIDLATAAAVDQLAI